MQSECHLRKRLETDCTILHAPWKGAGAAGGPIPVVLVGQRDSHQGTQSDRFYHTCVEVHLVSQELCQA